MGPFATLAIRAPRVGGGDPAAVARFGVALSLGMSVLGVILMRSRSWDVWAGVLIVPVISILTLPLIKRIAQRDGERWVFWVLIIAFAVKIIGAIVRYYATFSLLGPADAVAYHKGGIELATRFRAFDFDTHLDSVSEGPFIRLLTGIVYSVIGPSKGGAFIVFAWFGFLGLLGLYRAFRIAVPGGSARWYAALLFFFPSLVFWPSSIGKEAWMLLSIGVAAYGAARVLAGDTIKGGLWAVLGLALAFPVRPHIAGMIGVALATAYLARRARADGRRTNPAIRVAGVIVMLAVAGAFALQAEKFLQQAGIDTSQGLATALEQNADRTAIGANSDFDPTPVTSPVHFPLAVVTVLYRPFPFEANNLQSVIAAFETAFLFGLTVLCVRSAFTALRSARRQPYVMLCFVYLALFVVGFSSFANFGLLARERTQALPFLFVLLAMGSRRSRERDVAGA